MKNIRLILAFLATLFLIPLSGCSSVVRMEKIYCQLDDHFLDEITAYAPSMDRPVTSVIWATTWRAPHNINLNLSDETLIHSILEESNIHLDRPEQARITRKEDGSLTFTLFLSRDQHELEKPIVSNAKTLREFKEQLQQNSEIVCD